MTTSDLGQALLGLLARSPATGYDLSKRLRHPVAYFWAAQHSQVYPELARLEAAGLVSASEIPGRGSRPTRRYRVTAQGRRAHLDWVLSDVESRPIRDLETLHLWSLWLVEDPVAARRWVERRRAVHAERARILESERAGIEREGGTAFGQPRWSNRAAVESGIIGARAAVEWCDWLLTSHLPSE